MTVRKSIDQRRAEIQQDRLNAFLLREFPENHCTVVRFEYDQFRYSREHFSYNTIYVAVEEEERTALRVIEDRFGDMNLVQMVFFTHLGWWSISIPEGEVLWPIAHSFLKMLKEMGFRTEWTHRFEQEGDFPDMRGRGLRYILFYLINSQGVPYYVHYADEHFIDDFSNASFFPYFHKMLRFERGFQR